MIGVFAVSAREALDRLVELALLYAERPASVVNAAASDLPAWSSLSGLVGESHQRPHGLFVDVAAGRDLLVDREREVPG